MPSLISIVGPTASGKTALSVDLAQWLHAPVISADSVQIYRGLDIGSGKVTRAEMLDVPHYMIDVRDPDHEYNAGDYGRDVHGLLADLFQRYEAVLLVGGAGFYFQAVWEGFDDIPAVPAEVRAGLMAELGETGLEPLVEELRRVDPVTWEQIDRNNPARVVRALEVWRGSGQPISEFRGRKADRVNPWTDIRIGLNPMAMGEEREDMYRRIEARVDAMMAAGWLEETRKVGQKYGLDCKGLQSLGYRELVAHLHGKADLESTVELIKRNTRRYAKRQMTWFRRYPEIRWFSPEETGNIRGYLKSRLP